MQLYYLTIFDFDKVIILKTFQVSNENNTKYIIFMATNAYYISII